MDGKKELAQEVISLGLIQDDLKTQRVMQELDNAREEAILNRKERADIMRMRKKLVHLYFIVHLGNCDR